MWTDPKYYAIKTAENHHIKVGNLPKPLFLDNYIIYSMGKLNLWPIQLLVASDKKLTFILEFSIIAFKLKKDGSGFVMLPGVQKNNLWTLEVIVKINHYIIVINVFQCPDQLGWSYKVVNRTWETGKHST